jgi:signal transduction histidine kinase
MPRLATSGRSGSTVLVVDDQEDALDATRVLLEREGHRVLRCTNGEEALATLASSDVQLILVDYCMPMMNGADLIRAIRARDRYVQIVLQTGYAGPRPPRTLLAELDIQGYHNKADGPDALLMWVDVGLKATKLIQHLRERERMQAELVSNVSHEFRTPLNIIAGYSDMLLDGGVGALSEEAQATVRSIAQTNRSLGALVDNFLQYARVDAGMIEPSADRNVTRELIRELVDFGGVLVKAPHVRFAAEVGTVPDAFVTDAVKVRTILRNLIANAAKFTERGAVTLTMVARDGLLVFQIRDTGPGIAADKLRAVFEPFRQLGGSSSPRHGGVGLGLALSQRLARILGGTLELESTVGVGSTFTLTIPHRPHGSEGRSERSEPGGEGRSERSERPIDLSILSA